jgi:hypothetical protein
LQVLNLPKMAKLIKCPGTVSHAELSTFIATMQREAPWHAPIFQALLAGEIAVCMPLPGQSLPIKLFDQISKPVIVLICDDGPQWLGPDGWTCAARAMRWARAGMLHGSGGDAQHYRIALKGASERRRFLIVDTSSALLPSWQQLGGRLICDRRHLLSVQPKPGFAHPVDAELQESGR